MSSTATTTTNNSSSTYRVNYSEYVADITGSPKMSRSSGATGIGHHINPLHNPYPNQKNQSVQQTGNTPLYGGGSEKCARCNKTVYIAEKKVGAGRSFHTSCFSCHTCKRKLDSKNLSEHKGEIYCKSCYTKQFGAHGLISGVTMSTEQPVTREDHYPRRASYGNELDTSGPTNHQTRQRTYSNDNNLYDEYDIKQNDYSSKRSSQHDNIEHRQTSPSNKRNEGVNALIDTKYQRSSSPTRFNESNTNNDRHRSTYIEEDDRSKYVYEGDRISYGSKGTSALVDIPVTVTKRSDSTIDRFEVPVEPKRSSQRSDSPSQISHDSYQRQNSRDRQIDIINDYSRSHINEDNNKINRKSSNDNTVNIIPSEDPMTTQNYYQSSTSYETKYRNSTSNANNSDREQYHSRESSPSPTANQNRSPSPSTGYNTSSATRTISTTYRSQSSRDSPSPSTSYVPQYDYPNSQTSTNSTFGDRRSTSPQSNNRISSTSGLNEFLQKTNLAGNTSSSSKQQQNSTLSALVSNFRPHDDFDD